MAHALAASQAKLSGERFSYVCPYGLLETVVALGPGAPGAYVAMGQARCESPPRGLVRLFPGEGQEAPGDGMPEPFAGERLAKAMLEALPPYDFNVFDNLSALLQKTLSAIYQGEMPKAVGGLPERQQGGRKGGLGESGQGGPPMVPNAYFLVQMANSLANLSILESARRTNALAVLLAGHLKASIHDSARPFSTVGEEAASISRYLAMQKTRFGELLDYSVNIPQGLEGLPLPPDSLLPFVERSVCMGLYPGGAGLELRAAFSEEGGDILFALLDNAGLTAAAGRDQAPPPLSESSELRLVDERVGNSLARLAIAYGELPFLPSPGEGKEQGLTLRIPKTPKGLPEDVSRRGKARRAGNA
jgi:hypothetical protein